VIHGFLQATLDLYLICSCFFYEFCNESVVAFVAHLTKLCVVLFSQLVHIFFLIFMFSCNILQNVDLVLCTLFSNVVTTLLFSMGKYLFRVMWHSQTARFQSEICYDNFVQGTSTCASSRNFYENNSPVSHHLSTAVQFDKRPICTGLISIQCKIFANSNSCTRNAILRQ